MLLSLSDCSSLSSFVMRRIRLEEAIAAGPEQDERGRNDLTSSTKAGAVVSWGEL
jgi:hypothetical protein